LGRERNRRMFFASGVGLVQRLVQIGASLVSLPLALHVLGLSDFGVWGAATSLAWLSGMLDLGLGSALVTLIPRSIAAGKNELVRSHVAAALICGCGLSAVIVGVGGALVLVGVESGEVSPFLIAVLGLALNVPLSIAANVWFGLQKGHVAAGWELAQTLLALGLLVLAAECHGGVTAMVWAVYGALVLANSASLVHLIISHPEIRPHPVFPSWRSLRIVIEQSGMLFAISVAVACSYMFDNVLALHWLGETASAQMTTVMRLCTTAAGMLAVVTQPLWPAFVEATTVGDRKWALRTLSWGTIMVATLALGGATIIAVAGGQLLVWWLRSDIGIGSELLWSAGIWIIVMCTPRVAALLLSAALILRYQLIAASAALGLAILLKFVLGERFGDVGILSATPISWLLIMWPVYVYLTLRWRAKTVFGRNSAIVADVIHEER
jgi:O-antigen/teichoic acid export membrane protein